MKKYFLMVTVLMIVFSCGTSEKEKTDQKNGADTSVTQNSGSKVVLKKSSELSDQPGVAGIFEVPEMLTLCRKDSAASSQMPAALAKNYSLLEKDLKYLKITSQGAAGSIYYNNDTSNLIFECVYPIDSFPKKMPKKSTVVVLEAAPMLIYNHYGEYSDLYLANQNIQKYIQQNNLVQSGPIREFYITNPVVVKDHSKWITRLMVPVMNKKNK
ncbi:MAG: GyrI-like domain-containing protein [Bacteroidetes bacterium]|nr:GyrI-like domain-containing protein [Bacteroidota bacterium]